MRCCRGARWHRVAAQPRAPAQERPSLVSFEPQLPATRADFRTGEARTSRRRVLPPPSRALPPRGNRSCPARAARPPAADAPRLRARHPRADDREGHLQPRIDAPASAAHPQLQAVRLRAGTDPEGISSCGRPPVRARRCRRDRPARRTCCSPSARRRGRPSARRPRSGRARSRALRDRRARRVRLRCP